MLRLSRTLLRVAAFVGVLAAFVKVCLLAANTDHDTPFDAVTFLAVVVGAALSFVLLYGLSEAIDLMFEIRDQGGQRRRRLRDPQPRSGADEDEADGEAAE